MDKYFYKVDFILCFLVMGCILRSESFFLLILFFGLDVLTE